MRRLATALSILLLASCDGSGGALQPSPAISQPPTAAPLRELVLVTHDSFALPDEAISAFEDEQGASLRILRSGDAGSMVNQAILSREHPVADVLFGVDSTFLSRALAADIFLPYGSSELSAVPEVFQVDARQRVTPIDHGEVCLNIDLEAFATGDPPAPETLEDLTLPEYRGMLVVQDPASSSVGLAFLLATIDRFGEEGWREYWAALRENDVLVTDGWEDAYYGRFSGGAGEGDRPIVVSYASSPAAEVIFAETSLSEAPTAAVLDGCYRQVEFAGILQGTDEPELASAFIDHLLSRPVQESIPLEMFVYPVRGDAALPEVFLEHAQVVEDPLELPMADVEENRQRWIAEWTQTVLR
ncbi:MAG: thiamine ABC transporter substrate-binding protein [Chloroflexi bacterium]|nr:thiamine ABC transporter substrate-binding protein [Chloroflexota bacterium]